MPTVRSSSGAVLIVVLVLSAIIYLAVSTVLLMTMTEIHLSDFERRSIRAFYLAESAIALGVARLRSDPANLALFSDTVPGKFDSFNITFTPKPYDDHESRYNLRLEGQGVISGPTASAKRRVLREIMLKPFTLFAREQVDLQNLCRITGNIHGNARVDIGAGVEVEGYVSSHTEFAISEDAVLPEDEEPALEPEIDFPAIAPDRYWPKYLYKGQVYEAQALSLTTSIDLSSEEESSEPPAKILNVYRGQADLDKNPAGVFILNAEIDDETNETLSVIDVQGGSVLLPASVPFRLRGIVHITPVENFPALLKLGAEETSFSLISFVTLEDFLDVGNSEIAKLPKENSIEGLLYSLGTIMLTADSGSITIHGSIWANNIILKGNATCAVDFAPELLTNPPPGLNVVDYGEWRELFE
ncbi:MAG: hypothetical protein GY801_23840 [bacterium]|nr:hypothetical protein [bacterium]